MEPSPVLGVIPARLESSRLPRKPLHPILGRPLLEWVWRRVSSMSVFDRVVVACDSSEVEDLCVRIGAAVVRTDPGHPSGTDRVAEVAGLPEFESFDVIVNVQGDEPLIEEHHLRSAIDLVRGGAWEIGTCATPVRDTASLEDPAVVKVARAGSGGALYFSRAPIPFKRDGAPTADELAGEAFLRHVGVYAYRRAALERWVGLAPSRLEVLERLEQLRPLEKGIRIGVALVDRASPGVDTPSDVRRVEALLEAADTLSP